jgi:hypothetical protein
MGENTLYVTNEEYVLRFEGHTLIAERMPPTAIKLDPEQHAMIVWSTAVEDSIVDMWKAIGKALDVYSDEPGKAYQQGFAEGEAKVLREWNEALRGKE